MEEHTTHASSAKKQRVNPYTRKIVSINGRSSNILKLSDHDIAEASLSIVLHDFSNIVEAQLFHQNSLTDIEQWIVRGKDCIDKEEAQLKVALDKTFEKEVNCIIKYDKEMERNKSGKFRIVITVITFYCCYLIINNLANIRPCFTMGYKLERRVA